MELFKKLSEVMREGNTLCINIAKTAEGFTVSALPGSNIVKDAAKNRIQPLNMTGKAEDFDHGFEDAVIAPAKLSFGLLSEMQSFEESVEEARHNSEMEKKAKEEADKKKSDLDSWLQLAEYNLTNHKYKDARTCVAEAEKLADKGKQPQGIVKMKNRIDEADGGLFKSSVEDKSDGAFTSLASFKNISSEKASTEKSDGGSETA